MVTGKVAAPRVLHLLGQDEHWHTTDGRLLRINDMTRHHRRHALAWLRAHAEGLHRAHETEILLGPDDVATERAAHEHRALAPAVWLDRTPLVARLATLEMRGRFSLRRWLR